MTDSYSTHCDDPVNTIISTPTQNFSPNSNFNIENHIIPSFQPQNPVLRQKISPLSHNNFPNNFNNDIFSNTNYRFIPQFYTNIDGISPNKSSYAIFNPSNNSISHFDYLKFSFKYVAYQNLPFLSKIENNAAIDPDLTDDDDSDFISSYSSNTLLDYDDEPEDNSQNNFSIFNELHNLIDYSNPTHNNSVQCPLPESNSTNILVDSSSSLNISPVPECNNPVSQIPERPNQDSQFLERYNPVTQFPERIIPDSRFPENNNPDSQIPERIIPDSRFPERNNPESQIPEIIPQKSSHSEFKTPETQSQDYSSKCHKDIFSNTNYFTKPLHFTKNENLPSNKRSFTIYNPSDNKTSHIDYITFSFMPDPYENLPFSSKVEKGIAVDPDLPDEDDLKSKSCISSNSYSDYDDEPEEYSENNFSLFRELHTIIDSQPDSQQLSLQSTSKTQPHNLQIHNFTTSEDEIILQYISSHPSPNWNEVSSLISNKSPKACKSRYVNFLGPGSPSQSWSQFEDDLLLNYYWRLGPRCANQFPRIGESEDSPSLCY
ncbi:hypothetical protein M9Y10_005737 [Tritrichomonas musculus]|uniref:Myb-like domain-containing protein n=1 Tax=Tritrichomonas musculus TaxID=1915356 RepID=A0ABR2JDI4_9EUKA